MPHSELFLNSLAGLVTSPQGTKTTFMRFRLTTKPPLPSIKAWYALSPTPGFDITNLKAELLSRLPALQNQDLAYDQIFLSIDDFELLDDSGLDVIQENDIVWCVRACLCSQHSDSTRSISVVPNVRPASRKRMLDSSSLGALASCSLCR